MRNEQVSSVLAALAAKGCEPKETGKAQWKARCPAHDDRSPSLSVSQASDGKVLLKCFAGCELDAIVGSLGLSVKHLFPEDASHTRTCPPESRATLQHPTAKGAGCTLAQYAAAKRLPEAFLQDLGLSDTRYKGAPAVRIPYRGCDGTERAVRFRLALDRSGDVDNRFRWKDRSKPFLYGLDRLAEARAAGYVVIPEGESDCHTLWWHGFPAVGVPGAANWREDRDAPHLAGIAKVYVVAEPDNGGQAVLKWLGKSRIRDRAYLVRLDGHKDPSDLHLADPERFREHMQQAMETAEPWSEHVSRQAHAARDGAWKACREVAEKPRILDKFAEELQSAGVVGEDAVTKLLFLVLVSRLLERPVSVAVKGPSSAGKSYVVEQVLRFFPESAYYALSAMSERALAYSDEPLVHRYLVLYEALPLMNDMVCYLTRSLLSEGKVRYETVEKTAEGIRSRLIEREGPTGLVVTTTAIHLHTENETRLLSLTVNDGREQTRRVLLAEADEAVRGPDLAPWHALQEWLQTAEHRVTIPYAHDLANAIPPVAVRLRRDFSAVLGLIKAHAILHQANRSQDGNGAIVATIEDYAAVRELVAPLIAEGVVSTVPYTIRGAVEAVDHLRAEHADGVPLRAVAEALPLDKGAASRRVRSAVERGYLQNLEDHRGKKARLVLGEPLPDEVEILPAPEALAKGCCGVAAKTEG